MVKIADHYWCYFSRGEAEVFSGYAVVAALALRRACSRGTVEQERICWWKSTHRVSRPQNSYRAWSPPQWRIWWTWAGRRGRGLCSFDASRGSDCLASSSTCEWWMPATLSDIWRCLRAAQLWSLLSVSHSSILDSWIGWWASSERNRSIAGTGLLLPCTSPGKTNRMATTFLFGSAPYPSNRARSIFCAGRTPTAPAGTPANWPRRKWRRIF